jgi:hypothetical protein
MGNGNGVAGAGLGNVNGPGGIGHSAVRLAALPVLSPSASAPNGGVQRVAYRSTEDIGNFVRGRHAQMQFCYQEYGLKVNPGLAGLVTLEVTFGTGGTVRSVTVARKSWSGPGAAEAESCLRERVASWTFPGEQSPGDKMSLPLSFTYGGRGTN